MIVLLLCLGRLPGDEERGARSEFNYPIETASARGGSRHYGRPFGSDGTLLSNYTIMIIDS